MQSGPVWPSQSHILANLRLIVLTAFPKIEVMTFLLLLCVINKKKLHKRGDGINKLAKREIN